MYTANKMNTTGSTPALFQDLDEMVANSHMFLPVKVINGEMSPCIHVLCRSCLETVSSRTGKKSKDRMNCAVCQLEFEVPSIEDRHQRKSVAELLPELSKVANDIKHLCEERSCTWNEVKRRSASIYCTECEEHVCFHCADLKHWDHHRSIEKRNHWIEKPPNFGFCARHKSHVKQLEVFCIACCQTDCFMRLVDNLPYGLKDCDNILADEMQSLNEFSKETRAIKSQAEKEIELESWMKSTEKKIEVKYKELAKEIESHRDLILFKLKSFNTQVMKDLEQKTGNQTMHFDSFMTEHEIQIEASYEEPIKAIDTLKNSLLSEIKPANAEVKEELERKKSIVDALLKTVETYKESCSSIQSRGKADEKFCAIGAISKKVEEIETELKLLPEKAHPATANESPDLKKNFKTELQRESASGERSKNASYTFEMHARDGQSYEGRELTFSEVLVKYKEMLEKLRNRIIPNKIRAKDKRAHTLLNEEEVKKLRQQFYQVKLLRPDKKETKEWSSIEQLHTRLATLVYTEGEGQRLAKSLDQVNGITNDLLMKLNGLETRSQHGLENFGNTCYFNAAIQCLCQTFPLLRDFSSRNMSEQPLTQAFVEFWNHRCVDSHQQNEAFSKFFKQLFTSSPKFNNFRQHDSHDLFIHFLNELRSEERIQTTKELQSNVDPKKVLTTVDKVFGGHFITMYACLRCNQPYFVCECLLDISLPICIPTQQNNRGGGSGGTHQGSKQRGLVSTANKGQTATFYSEQDNKLKRGFLEALNEEQRILTVEEGSYYTKPVTLTECLRFYTEIEHIPEGYLCLSCQDANQSAATVNAQAMPPALKRTLIYNPPAILVLHMKRFERTTTGFMKRRDKVVYEELLDLGPYCSSDCLRIDPEDKNVWYSLYGVVVHSGSLDCGHYSAYVKKGELKAESTMSFFQKRFLDRDIVAYTQKKKLAGWGEGAVGRKMKWQPSPATDHGWIYMSDSYTQDVSSHEALDQEAFMLFYERIPKYGQ